MSISEAERHEIYELIRAATSDRVANNVMSLLPPVGWADVATKTDLESLRTEMHAEFGSVGSEFGSVRSEFGSVRSEFDSVRTEFSVVRADMRALEANLRTEMHQSIRSQTWALIAWTTGLAGLIVALVR